MSDPPKDGTLCERCSLLSFDDAAIGGYEVIGEDGVARLAFPESKIESRPTNWMAGREFVEYLPGYRLVRLDWKLEEIFPDMPHLSRSCQLDCMFCQVLHGWLQETLATEAEFYPEITGALSLIAYLALEGEGIEGLVVEATYQISFAEHESVVRAMFPIEAGSGTSYNLIKCGFLLTNYLSKDCGEWFGAETARETSYLAPVNIRRIRQLLGHCTSKCHPETSSSFMPTRLIDVGHNESAVPRLVLSSDIHEIEPTKYAALSYCWGDETDAESQFKTETSTLEQRCEGLPSEFMTPTTNDAITLAKAIGLRYLWIDALCIIQDDKDDWSHESSQMGLVYRHAFVTFCSLNSNSCHESFLHRAPAIAIPFQSNIRKVVKGSYLIRLRPASLKMGRTKYRRDYLLSAWNTRCWTYQEEEMSTRLLLFGSLRMHFACARCQWSEGDEAPQDRSNNLRILDKIIMFKDCRISSGELYKSWSLTICNYGHRSVTSETDRLPAIAGLARMLGEALQDQYLAGLWKGDLQYGLTWYSRGDMLSRGLRAHIHNIKERKYVAPSWSWAASPEVASLRERGTSLVEESDIMHATTNTDHEDLHGQIMVEESDIVHATTNTDHEDLYGQVTGGLLRIRGKMSRWPSWSLDQQGTWWSNAYVQPKGDYDFVHISTDWLSKGKEAGLDVLKLILLHRIENSNGTNVPSLRALLLHPADESNHYYRVGVVYSEGQNGYTWMRSWFEDSQEETICII